MKTVKNKFDDIFMAILEEVLERSIEGIYFGDGKDSEGNCYVIFGDWNSRNKFVEIAREVLGIENLKDHELERMMEAEFVFSDEYTTCDDCGTVIAYNRDVSSRPQYFEGDGFICCLDCFEREWDYQKEYLERRINNYNNANELLSNEQLKELGFTRYNVTPFVNGLYEGQDDNPEKIYNELKDKYEDILFSIDSYGHFETEFSVWVRGEIK